MDIIEAARETKNYNQFSWNIVLLVMLDIKNPFNSVKWSNMPEHLNTHLKYWSASWGFLMIIEELHATLTPWKESELRWLQLEQFKVHFEAWLRSVYYDSLLRAELVGYAENIAALMHLLQQEKLIWLIHEIEQHDAHHQYLDGAWSFTGAA